MDSVGGTFVGRRNPFGLGQVWHSRSGAGGGSDAHNYRGSPVLTNATVANGFATSGTVDNFKAVVRNHNEGSDDDWLESL